MRRGIPGRWLLTLILLLLAAAPAAAAPAAPTAAARTYTNPLDIAVPGGGKVESCADPSIIREQAGDGYWYVFCTTDPLNDSETAGGSPTFHLIPIVRSRDLVSWEYVGDAFAARPAWVRPDAGLWAPDIEYFGGTYFLYYTASDTVAGGSAIGVATSASPAGPWVDSGAPAVEPHEAPCCPGSRRWVFDPDVIEAGGQRYIFYGSYYGGISARALSPDGLRSDPASQVQVAIDNKYEGANIVLHDGFYYLLASATNCCNGPLTGYSVFAGRSASPLGPYVDKSGASLLDPSAGGSVVISMNGNRWVGPGHNAVFTDLAGQDWMIYHAVDRGDPYFAGAVGFTKRPALIDPLDWVDGWPTVRGGLWASDGPMPAPAAQPGDPAAYQPWLAPEDERGHKIGWASDEFNGVVNPRWEWVRPPALGTYAIEGGALRIDTQAADLYVDSNDASVLTEAAPQGDYVVEARVKLDVPAEGCCFNYVQAGLVIYGDDDNFIKLTSVSIWDTRQTEFAKEQSPVPAGYPRYGNTVVGPPGEWTYLRVVRRADGAGETYRAYTSRDGTTWERGGVWTHALGGRARIGLVAMGGSGFHAYVDYVRTFALKK